MTQRNQKDVRSGNNQANDAQRTETNRKPGGQQQDGNLQQGGGQPGDDERGNRRGVQPDDRSNRLDVTGERGAGGNRQEGNKDKQRGGGDEKAQQLKNQGQEGGKSDRRGNR